MHSYFQGISNYLLVGLLGAIGLLWGITYWLGLRLEALSFSQYVSALIGGLALGLGIKALMLFCTEMVMRASAASAQLNAKRAKMIGYRLKLESRDKIQAHVIKHAKDIILQMHGEQVLSDLDQFFEQKIEELSEEVFSKIERHLNYLTDRAVHGDVQSLKRLYKLYPRQVQAREKEIDQLLDRIINTPEEINKLKDKIDTLYDFWKFKNDARFYF